MAGFFGAESDRRRHPDQVDARRARAAAPRGIAPKVGGPLPAQVSRAGVRRRRRAPRAGPPARSRGFLGAVDAYDLAGHASQIAARARHRSPLPESTGLARLDAGDARRARRDVAAHRERSARPHGARSDAGRRRLVREPGPGRADQVRRRGGAIAVEARARRHLRDGHRHGHAACRATSWSRSATR